MTVSGILAGLTDPYGGGFALTRAAVRLSQASPVLRRDPERAAAADDEHSPAPHDGDADESVDRVELSDAARNAGQPDARSGKVNGAADGSADAKLSDEDKQQVEELKARDSEVRAHEQAHLAAAGAHSRGGATFEFETGPDGRRYAVGGEVQIDTSPVEGNPEATIAKMEQIRSAALAPASPSSADRAIAAQAAAQIRQARAEKTQPPQEEESRPTGSAGRSHSAGGTDESAAARDGGATAGRGDRVDATGERDTASDAYRATIGGSRGSSASGGRGGHATVRHSDRDVLARLPGRQSAGDKDGAWAARSGPAVNARGPFQPARTQSIAARRGAAPVTGAMLDLFA